MGDTNQELDACTVLATEKADAAWRAALNPVDHARTNNFVTRAIISSAVTKDISRSS